jgi:hypothetical protein
MMTKTGIPDAAKPPAVPQVDVEELAEMLAPAAVAVTEPEPEDDD